MCITLFIRYDGGQLNVGGIRSFPLKPGNSEDVALGGVANYTSMGSGYPIFTNGSAVSLEQKVTQAGSTFDKLLNENLVLIISDPLESGNRFIHAD